MWEVDSGNVSHMGNIAKQLAIKLKKLRGDKSQVQFSKELGISKSSLNRLEIGEQNISLRTIELLCKRLKCSASDLFKFDD